LQDPGARSNAPAVLKVLEDILAASEMHDCSDVDSFKDKTDVCDFDGGTDHCQQNYETCSPPNDSGFAHSFTTIIGPLQYNRIMIAET